MRILFGDADRDLLRCYEQLLTDGERTVETAFDGAQVLTKLRTMPFDLLIVGEAIPRVGLGRILETCAQLELPVIVLLKTQLTVRKLLSRPTPSAYLSHPFLSEELTRLIDSVTEKRASTQVLQFGQFAAYPREFSLETVPVTAHELDVLTALHEEQPTTQAIDPICIGALNARFLQLGLPYRIQYQKNTGYRVVTDRE